MNTPKYNCKFCGNTDGTNPAECYTTQARDVCPRWGAICALSPHNRRRTDTEEQINHPQHYGGDTTFETIKVLESWLTPEEFAGFCIGNAIKYESRWRKKGGLEDLSKSQWYLNKYLEFRQRQKDTP